MKLPRALIIVAMIALLLGVAAMTYAQNTIAPGDTIQGELNSSTAQYSFTAKAGETVIISLNSDVFDPLIELYDANDIQVGRDDDSGGYPNARLVFTAPQDGSYTINVMSFSGVATGAYTLTLESQVATAITYDTPVDTKMAGITPLYFTFSGAAGDVLDIFAVSATDEDTRLTLRGPDGLEVASDDDNGEGANPYIRHAILPSTGAYQVELAPFGGSELSGNITVTVEQTELLTLSATPQTVKVGGDNPDVEVFSVEVTAGTTYRIVVGLDASSTAGASIEILNPGSTFSDTGISAYGATSRLAMDFAATASGQAIVRIRSSAFTDEGTEITVSLETPQ